MNAADCQGPACWPPRSQRCLAMRAAVVEICLLSSAWFGALPVQPGLGTGGLVQGEMEQNRSAYKREEACGLVI